jgi:hypothetical protein
MCACATVPAALAPRSSTVQATPGATIGNGGDGQHGGHDTRWRRQLWNWRPCGNHKPVPTRTWESRTEREIPTFPQPIIVASKKKKKKKTGPELQQSVTHVSGLFCYRCFRLRKHEFRRNIIALCHHAIAVNSRWQATEPGLIRPSPCCRTVQSRRITNRRHLSVERLATSEKVFGAAQTKSTAPLLSRSDRDCTSPVRPQGDSRQVESTFSRIAA